MLVVERRDERIANKIRRGILVFSHPNPCDVRELAHHISENGNMLFYL
jgi:hypothetical protein